MDDHGARPHDTLLDPDDYLRHLGEESRRFRAALTEVAEGTAVPTCPGWDAADLLHHLSEVQDGWSQAIEQRPEKPAHVELPRAASYAEALESFDTAHARLVDALSDADPAQEAWNWSADHTVGFILRRQAHEALVHRLDAELAAGAVSAVDAQLAADCVEECLDVMYGGAPDWGTWEGSDAHLRVDCTDTDDQVWVRLGRFTGQDPQSGDRVDEEDLHVVADPGTDPDAVLEGAAADLAAWLWARGDDASLRTAGDDGVLARFRAMVSTPIN